MTLLFDQTKKEVINVPEDQVSAAVASGSFAFRKNARIPVMSPSGEVGSIDATEATEAFRNGYVFQTRKMSEDLTAARLKASRSEAFDMPLAAGVIGALRGATLGASDLIARGVGLDDEFLALQQENPIASTVGEVVGGVGASVVAAPATAALAAGATARLGAGALARVGGAAAALGTEGLVQSAGSVLSQASLGDPALTTDSALMQLGLGTVLSGGIGAFGKGATETISSTISAIRNSTLPGATASTIGKAYSKLSGIVKGLNKEDAELVERIYTKDMHGVVDMIDNPQKFESQAIDAIAKTREIGETVMKATMDVRQAERKILVQAVPFELRTQALALKNEIGKVTQFMKSKSGLYDKGTIAPAQQIMKDMEVAIGRSKTVGEVHEAVNLARTALDDYTLKYGGQVSPGKAAATREIFNELRGKFKSHLVDQKLYGEYGKKYEAINEAYTKYANTQQKFDDVFTRSVVNERGAMVQEIDKGKVVAWFRNPEKIVSLEKEFALDELAESIKKLASVHEASQTLPKALGAAKGAGEQIAQEIPPSGLVDFVNEATGTIDRIRDIRGKAILLGRLESVTGRALMSGMTSAAIGGALAGPVGVAAGSVIGTALGNPKSVLKILARLENLGVAGQARVANRVNSALSGAVVGAAKNAQRIGGGTTRRVTAPALVQILAPESKETPDYESARKTLDGLDGVELDKRLVELNPFLDDASPAVFAELHQRTMNAARFVRSKFPGIDTSDMFGAVRELSHAEREKIDAYTDAAFRPERALEELETDAPDPRVFEALGAVYPSMYDHLQKTVLHAATAAHSTLSYKRKLALGIAFGIPATPSLANTEVLMAEPVGLQSRSEQSEATPRPVQRAPSRVASAGTTEKALSSLSTQTEKIA